MTRRALASLVLAAGIAGTVALAGGAHAAPPVPPLPEFDPYCIVLGWDPENPRRNAICIGKQF